MRFGICAPPEQAVDLARAGYDYVEWPLRDIAALNDEGYAALRALARGLSVAPEAYNVMLPGSIMVVGPEADPQALRAYLEPAFGRAAELGGAIVVFGSGGSRRIPEGWPHERGRAQLVEACGIAGEIAAQHGLLVPIEPLNPRETNLVTTVAEAASVAAEVGHPAVRVLSDLYHVGVQGEDFAGTAAAGALLAHVHVATPDGRAIPLPGRADGVLRDYFRALRDAGYDGRISVEGLWTPDEAAAGAAHLREIWAQAQMGPAGT
jgi:sugar phosphate isomerase/epimerase